MNPRRHLGFTLIELSIVLVIIGLVIGGVMTGRVLIQQAEVRASASILQKLEISYRTFQGKYNCLPGDCKNATDFFGVYYAAPTSGCPPSGGAGNGNGNGDGYIDNGGYGWDWTCEPWQAIASLSVSNLLPTAATTAAWPCSTSPVYFKGINDSCAFFYKDDLYAYDYPDPKNPPINVNSITWANFYSGNVYNAALSPVQSRLIDEKIDDGKPDLGKYRGMDAALPGSTVITTDSCSTAGKYNLNENYSCRALYYFK